VPTDSLELTDYRRRVARIYGDVLAAGPSQQSWDAWRAARIDLFLTHPQSPVMEPGRFEGTLPYFDYDPTWNLIGTVEPLADDDMPAKVAEGDSVFTQIGTVRFVRAGQDHSLALFWLGTYGGGLLLPFRDLTNRDTTYGAGRYLLDGAKSADLGATGPSTLVLDFNFAYHPSCMWDPQWACPLAPPTSHLTVPVEAGEQMPEFPTPESPDSSRR